VRGWRLAARGVPPGGLRRFRLAALRLFQALKLQVPGKHELLYAVMLYLDQEMLCHEWVGSWMVVNT